MWTEIDAALARVASAVNHITSIVAVIESLAHWQSNPEVPQAAPVVAGALAEQAQTQAATSEQVASVHHTLMTATAELANAHAALQSSVTTAQATPTMAESDDPIDPQVM